MGQRGCAMCPFLGMSFDRELRASYAHPSHVCWSTPEQPTLQRRLQRWLSWRPWQAGEASRAPWRALPFTPLAPAEQGRCLGSAYAACPHFPPSTSMLRRLTLAAGGLAR